MSTENNGLHPFPIPESVRKAALQRIAGTRPPWESLDLWAQDDEDPMMFGYFNCWRGRARQALTATELLIQQIEPEIVSNQGRRMQWDAVTGTLYSLALMLDQFEGFMEWARLTWPHDPTVKKPRQGGGRADLTCLHREQ